MPTYNIKRDTWLSHECRIVREGEQVTTTFPEGMKLGSNLEEVKPEEVKKGGKKPADDLAG